MNSAQPSSSPADHHQMIQCHSTFHVIHTTPASYSSALAVCVGSTCHGCQAGCWELDLDQLMASGQSCLRRLPCFSNQLHVVLWKALQHSVESSLRAGSWISSYVQPYGASLGVNRCGGRVITHLEGLLLGHGSDAASSTRRCASDAQSETAGSSHMQLPMCGLQWKPAMGSNKHGCTGFRRHLQRR